MLLLEISLNAALIFSAPILAIPVISGAPKLAGAALNGHQSSSQPAEFQQRSDPSGGLVLFNEALSSSNPPARLPTKVGHEIDCFAPDSKLPYANAEDCDFIINNVIVAMKEPFEEQTWGYTDDEDNNLSLPKYRWIFKDCLIRVSDIDKDQVDFFSPVEVAQAAQKVLQDCVTGAKVPLGGVIGIGHLEIPINFFVAVSGSTKPSGQSLGNNTVLSLPRDGLHTLESRASLISPQEETTPGISTERLNAGEEFPVSCFDPGSVHRLKHTVAADCVVIVNELILRLPNPMLEQTFGFTDADDINLTDKNNARWTHGRCTVFITALATTDRDRFRYIDVARTALRITEKCVEGSKYAIGGTAAIGTMLNHFYIGVGGVGDYELGNGSILGLASDGRASSPLQAVSAISASHRASDAESANLDKRSNNIIELLRPTKDFAPPVTCLQPGAPTARKIEFQDCSLAALLLLRDPMILVPRPFTTEATGGIKLPFIQHHGSCYFKMDTKSKLSISVIIPLLKMVYWALEIMLKCIAGRAVGFGGESLLDDDMEVVVSVTGVDPTSVGNRLQ